MWLDPLWKEKLPQDPRDENDIPKGIVKWLVEILDETEEPVIGVSTILTMVAKKNHPDSYRETT